MTHAPTRHRRFIAGVLAGAMALAVTPILGLTGTASAADDPPPVADPIGDGKVCEDAPEEHPFTDIEGDGSHDEIVCLFQSGITKGKTADTFAPGGILTRREMALFLKRAADTAEANEIGNTIEALPEYDGEEDYPDIGDESAEVKEAIGQLSQAEIALGHDDGTYRPAATLKRRQMAKFVVRTIEYLTGEELTASGDYFDDDEGDSAEEEFNQLAELGIFAGDGQGNVNPGGDLSRRQMASILTRTFQVLFQDDLIRRLFPEPGAALIADVTATADESFPSVADANDVHRFIFSEPMSPTIEADGSAYSVEGDGGGTAEIDCGGAAACHLNKSTLTIGSEEKPPGTVLTVTLSQPLVAPGPNSPVLQYPLGITEVTAEWVDAEGGTAVSLAGSDTEIQVNEDAAETKHIAPRPTSAAHTDDTPDAVTVTFSENVVYNGDPDKFTVIASDGACGDEPVNNGTASEVTEESDDEDEHLVVLFGNGNVAAGDYQLCVEADAVDDLDGNPNPTQVVPVTFN